MTFNTGNNVPSTDPRDLYDNAENLDKLVNGVDPFYADRKGVLRESWAGMENTFDTSQTGRENAFALSQADKESRFQAFLVSSGYVSRGDYAAGVVLAERNEYVAVNAATTGTTPGLYRPNASATLPLTLTGTWATDAANLVLLGDDVLRQELASTDGASMIGGGGQVVSSIASLRDLVKTSPSKSAFVTGYYSQGDGGGGAYYLDAADTTTVDNGGTVIVAADGGRWKLKHSGFVNVRQFGAKLDGVSDDTAAVMAAYAAVQHIIVNNGICCVTNLDFSTNNRRVQLINAQFYGIATTATDCIVRLRNSRHCRYEGLEIETDGNAATPVYHPNYGCAIRLVSESSSTPVQFNIIDGLSLRYIKYGIVLGNFLGEAAQASAPQSENFIRGFKTRGVLCPIYSNAINSYITFTDHVVQAQQNEANASWFVPANGWCARCDEGSLMFIGGEFQRALSAGYSLYGKNISVIGPIWEVGTRCYVTGDMSISNCTNGSMGPGTEPVFEISAAATGRLLLENFISRRPGGTASTNRLCPFELNGNNDYRVVIDNSRLFDWAWTAVNSNALFAKAGNFVFNGLMIDNSASDQPSYYLNESSNLFVSADATGQSMATTADVAAKGGWSTAAASGAFYKYTADLPPGETSAIRFTSSSATLAVSTPTGTSGSRIKSGKDNMFEAWLKRVGTTTANTFMSVSFYDFAGASLGSQTLITTDGARLDGNGFNNWQKFRAPMKPPSGSAYFSVTVSLPSTGGDIALSGITVK